MQHIFKRCARNTGAANNNAVIEAIFYQRASTAESVAWAKALHADFIKRYGAASLPPLVVYDHGRVEAPFSLSA